MSSPWVHPQFDPIALALGPLAIHWYGLMYLCAFGAFYGLGRLQIAGRAAHTGMTVRDLDDLLLWGALGVVLGGRLGYVLFYKPDYYLQNPAEILALWQGGMAFHGGLLGVILAMVGFSASRTHLGGQGRLSRTGRFWVLADFVAPLVPLGLAFGRLGNFINGELWGRTTDPSAPWAMVFPQAGDGLARHPSQLYQMVLEGLVLFGLLWWFSARRRPAGQVAGLFMLGYGLARFVVEFAREPDAFLGLLSMGLSMGQWLSLPMVAVGLALLWWAPRREYTDR
ncbi:MAG: prolipoprotein diacylglyceryl transferase [Pseudomonadota bacterium]|jgi:phosphatidylglycerol:prolipoprotein diacylglycerol transferase